MSRTKTIIRGLAVPFSVALAAAYVMYASGILMPSTKSGRVSPPDFSGNAAASQPASPSTQQLILMAGSKSKAPTLTTPTTRLTLLPGSKAPATLVGPSVTGAEISPSVTFAPGEHEAWGSQSLTLVQQPPPATRPATAPAPRILIHGSKSAILAPPRQEGTSKP